MPSSEEFLKHLRDALNHLYDPDRLRRNPLTSLFGVAGRFDAPLAMQHTLTDAIETLKPEPDELPQSRQRRIYDLLLYRYVQQFSQQEVANQLGLSVRHLRREQAAALEALAFVLWEQFDLEERQGDEEGEDEEETDEPQMAVSPSVNDELAWVKDAPPEQSTDLEEVLPAALDLARPLAVQHDVEIMQASAEDLPRLSVDPIALRQTLLNLISAAVQNAEAPDGQVRVEARPAGWDVEISVQCLGCTTGELNDDTARLDMARRLASLCGGGLALSTEEGAFSATLRLPALEALPVLVIDDNVDTLQLLQRYASGTRYRLIGVPDPRQAIAVAERVSPRIIVLDVMMPRVDGWEILGRLREHPATEGVPVVVCTIMAQEDLALSLGASAFVRKPVTRRALLSALDQLAAPKGSEPH